MTMRLNGWRAVDAVLRTGSLAAAALDLAVTPAAVAAQIRGLEAALGQALFDRGREGLQPRPKAAAVAPRLAAAFSLLADLETELTLAPPGRGVSVAVSQMMAEIWLPRHMPTLFETLPEIQLTLDTGWAPVDLARADVDFAVRFCGPVAGDLDSIDLFPSGVVPVCLPEIAARHGLGPGRGDLEGVPLTHIDVPSSDPDLCDWPGWSVRTGIALPTRADASLHLTGSGLRLALSGAGLVLGGLAEVLDALRSGALVMPLGPASICPAGYWHRLVWHRRRRHGPMQRRFKAWIAARAAEDRAEIARLYGV